MRNLFITGLLATLMAAGPALAAPPWKREHVRPAVNHAGISLADAIEKVRASTGGRVIGASQGIDRTGRPVYLVKVLLPNGVVRTMQVPAQ